MTSKSFFNILNECDKYITEGTLHKRLCYQMIRSFIESDKIPDFIENADDPACDDTENLKKENEIGVVLWCRGDIKGAEKHLLYAANCGYITACKNLSEMYLKEKRYDDADYSLKIGVVLGDVYSAYNLAALSYMNGMFSNALYLLMYASTLGGMDDVISNLLDNIRRRLED